MFNLTVHFQSILASGLILALCPCLLFESTALSSTHNFYFNNVNQGSNGSANPSVKTDSQEEEKAEEKNQSSNLPADQSSPLSEPAPTASPPRPEVNEEFRKPDVRFHGGYQWFRNSVQYLGTNKGDNYFSANSGKAGTSNRVNRQFGNVNIDLSICATSWLAFRTFIGTDFSNADSFNQGFEAEVIPIRLGKRLELGGVVGGLYTFQPYEALSFVDSFIGITAFTGGFYYGLHSTLFFSHHIGLSAAYRTSFNSSTGDGFSFRMAEAGLTYRF